VPALGGAAASHVMHTGSVCWWRGGGRQSVQMHFHMAARRRRPPAVMVGSSWWPVHAVSIRQCTSASGWTILLCGYVG